MSSCGFMCYVSGRVDPTQFFYNMMLTFPQAPRLAELKQAVEHRVQADRCVPDGAPFIVSDFEILDFRVGLWVTLEARAQLYSGCHLSALRSVDTASCAGATDRAMRPPHERVLRFAVEAQLLFEALDDEDTGALRLPSLLRVFRRDVDFAIGAFAALDRRGDGVVQYRDFLHLSRDKELGPLFAELQRRVATSGAALRSGGSDQSSAGSDDAEERAPSHRRRRHRHRRNRRGSSASTSDSDVSSEDSREDDHRRRRKHKYTTKQSKHATMDHGQGPLGPLGPRAFSAGTSIDQVSVSAAPPLQFKIAGSTASVLGNAASGTEQQRSASSGGAAGSGGTDGSPAHPQDAAAGNQQKSGSAGVGGGGTSPSDGPPAEVPLSDEQRKKALQVIKLLTNNAREAERRRTQQSRLHAIFHKNVASPSPPSGPPATGASAGGIAQPAAATTTSPPSPNHSQSNAKGLAAARKTSIV